MSEGNLHPVSTVTDHKGVTEPMKVNMFCFQSRVLSGLLLQKRLQIGRVSCVRTVRDPQ